MRTLCILAAVLLATHASAYERFVSPNGKFEAYTAAHWPDGTGMKLFLRRAGARDTGALLWENNRWVNAKWSPDSRFLAVIDGMDGHITDVYVFAVTSANGSAPPSTTLFYHTPNLRTYDVQWDVIGWRAAKRQIILEKEARDQNGGAFKTEKIIAHIGTDRMRLPAD